MSNSHIFASVLIVLLAVAATCTLAATVSSRGPDPAPSLERCGRYKKVKQGDKVIPCYGGLCKCTGDLCCNVYGFCGKTSQHCSKAWGCDWRFGKCSFPAPDMHLDDNGPQYGQVAAPAVSTSGPLTVTKIISPACANCKENFNVAAFQSAVDAEQKKEEADPPVQAPQQNIVDEGPPKACPSDLVPTKPPCGSPPCAQPKQSPCAAAKAAASKKIEKPKNLKLTFTRAGDQAPGWGGDSNGNKALAHTRDVLNPSGY
jgi:hypothetical protein